jgi:hypothetical protein
MFAGMARPYPSEAPIESTWVKPHLSLPEWSPFHSSGLGYAPGLTHKH